MKSIITVFILLSSSLICAQQDFKVVHTTGKIILEEVDNATISSYDGKEVIISVNGNVDKEVDDRARGLKVINSLGLEDNTGLSLSVTKKGEDLLVQQVGTCPCHDGQGYIIKLPRSVGVDFSHSTYESDELTIDGVKEEIIVSTNYTDVHINNVSGPMSIKTVYGDIDGHFDSVNQDGSISIYSVYGFVDIGVPASAKTDLSLKTPYGEIYTDLNIEVAKTEGMRSLSNKSVTGTLNGGGVDFVLKSGYENIYLRKN